MAALHESVIRPRRTSGAMGVCGDMQGRARPAERQGDRSARRRWLHQGRESLFLVLVRYSRGGKMARGTSSSGGRSDLRRILRGVRFSRWRGDHLGGMRSKTRFHRYIQSPDISSSTSEKLSRISLFFLFSDFPQDLSESMDRSGAAVVKLAVRAVSSLLYLKSCDHSGQHGAPF